MLFRSEKEGLAEIVCRRFGLKPADADMADWHRMVDALEHPEHKVRIALVGKYAALRDSYLSVVEALTHGGIRSRSEVDIKWVDADEVEYDQAHELFGDVDGILVPGGFGTRGIEGKIVAARYARENQVPYLGICLGMQTAIIEFARNVLGLKAANSAEIEPTTPYPVIDLMPEQKDINQLGGTMRLGQYPCADRKSVV